MTYNQKISYFSSELFISQYVISLWLSENLHWSFAIRAKKGLDSALCVHYKFLFVCQGMLK